MIEFIDQPFDGQLGTVIKGKLSEDKYKHFVIVSAFAKNSGVLRIKESLQDFRNRGGKIDAIIGLDAHGTSYEALVNLFYIVDSLYIVHDNNPSITFHSKLYYLSDLHDCNWLAVGSNNLTGGGLWTNYETTSIVSTDSEADSNITKYFDKYVKLIERYQENCNFALKINDVSELDNLLKIDLVRREIDLQIGGANSRKQSKSVNGGSSNNLFGTIGRIHIPAIKIKYPGKKVKVTDHNVEITSIQPITPSDNAEKMWFETRKMTGGSRNILDLSMLGNIEQGNADGTRYMTDKKKIILGSVVFFDIDPSNTSIEKDVTINYNAKDYPKIERKGNIHASPNLKA